MKQLNWPKIQKDNEGNLILYPATFLFSRKGYIIPDEKIRKDFININIPIFVLGAITLLHSIDYGFFLFGAVYAIWQLVLYIVHYNFFKKYSASKRRFSWKEHFDDLNREYSKFCLSAYISIWFLAGIFFVKYFIISTDNAPLFIGLLGLFGSAYTFLVTLLAIIHRDR